MQIDPDAKSIKVGTDDATLDGERIILKIAVKHKSEASSEKLTVSIKFALQLLPAFEEPLDADADDNEVGDSESGFVYSSLDLNKELEDGGLAQL